MIAKFFAGRVSSKYIPPPNTSLRYHSDRPTPSWVLLITQSSRTEYFDGFTICYSYENLPSEGGRSVLAKISGGRGRLWGIFFLFLRATYRRFDTIVACHRRTDGRTDGQTDGIAVASIALAERRAVKMWYKNNAGRFFALVAVKHACDRRTDRRTELRLPRPR